MQRRLGNGRGRAWRAGLVLALLSALTLPLAGVAGPAPSRVLVPIGGAYTSTTLKGFARAAVANGASAPTVDILVVPSSYGDDPRELDKNIKLAGERVQEIDAACDAVVAAEYARQYSGCTATLQLLFTRAQAEDPANSAAFADPGTDGAFILGGDQTIAMRVLANTPAEAAMASAFARGMVFGGTSAGAAVESESMIAGFTASGYPENGLERGAVEVWWAGDGDADRGLNFGSDRTILDQHFYERGRFGRLLNVVAQSDGRFGGQSRLGVGIDRGTGAPLHDDKRLSGVFGSTSAAVIDFETGNASIDWRGPRQTLSARNVLTHILAAGPVSYDVAGRRPLNGKAPVSPPTLAGWSPALLGLPALGGRALILGGDVSSDWTGPALAEFVSRVKAAGSNRVVILAAGFKEPGQANSTAEAYLQGLRAAGLKDNQYLIETVAYGSDPNWSRFDPGQLAGAAGVLFVGGDQALLAGPLADGKFVATVAYALANAPVTMTDRAMTAVMGDWYVANPDPTDGNYQSVGINAFKTGDADVRPGLGIVAGTAFEPRLTRDQRWGRLYGLAMAQPGAIAFGISERTALVVGSGGASVAGTRSVVGLDGRGATFLQGTNGAFTALNVYLDLFAPGEAVQTVATR